MATIALTGSAGGIGTATRARLEADGHRVIGIDTHDAEVIADLSFPGTRKIMLRDVEEACDGALDGLVAAAGMRGDDGAAIVSVNHFGAVAALEGLRHLLERSTNASVVALCSNSASTQPGYAVEVAEWCLADDEARARALAAEDPMGAYAASKLALALWVRRQATQPQWVGAGIRLNGVAPGYIDTPMTAGTWDFVSNLDDDVWPIPMDRPGTPDEVAALIAYLLSPEAAFFCGSVVVMDGGTEAALRPDDWPRPPGL